MEMQGCIGELGREMARFATSPGMLYCSAIHHAIASSFAIHAQTSSSITIHSHSVSPNTPQASVSRISSYRDLRRRESVSPPFIPPFSIRAEQPRSRLPYLGLSSSRPRRALTTAITPNNKQLWIRVACRALALALCALDPYPLPAFLRPPRHLQRLFLLACRRRGRDSRWWQCLSAIDYTRKVIEY